jgi:RNA polymerase sigma factor (sigma-70 family)
MAGSHWPGPHEKQVVTEMLENHDSEHWEKCNELMRWLILGQANKLSVVLSADLVDEILQNTMTSIVIHLPHFRFESKLTTWLMPIAYSRTIDALRMRSRDSRAISPPNNSLEEEENEVITRIHEIAATVEDECITNEELREVLAEIEIYINSHAKPERNRRIAEMVLLEGHTLEEVAQEVGVSSAVASYVIRSLRRHLREKIKEDHANPPSTDPLS